MYAKWLNRLKENLLCFLQRMQGKKGFFKYSLSGDLYNEKIHWGLGNSVFALKLYYMIDSLHSINLDEIYKFVISFQKPNGHIYDSFLHKKGFLRNLLFSIKNKNFRNLGGEYEKTAETRQSFSSLFLINLKPNQPFLNFLKTDESIINFLSGLNWSKPWAAGSHFSHLIFFLHNMKKYYPKHFRYDDKKLTDSSIDWINHIQRGDGSWYIGNPTLNEKINGAMKVITGLNILNIPIMKSEKLIDLALKVKKYRHACDSLNTVYVLYNCAKQLKFSYKQDEIEDLFLKYLEIYKNHYYENVGGFSFFHNKTNMYYYGAKIAQGLSEPDIHGTLMFTWGICLIAETLGFKEELAFKPFHP